jgi:hypothetical protein
MAGGKVMRRTIFTLINDPRCELPAVMLLGTICLAAIVLLCRSPTKDHQYNQTYIPVAVPRASGIALTALPTHRQSWIVRSQKTLNR